MINKINANGTNGTQLERSTYLNDEMESKLE